MTAPLLRNGPSAAWKPQLRDRFDALVDKLTRRLERQTLRPGADHPTLVALVGTFDTLAGEFDRLDSGVFCFGVQGASSAFRRLRDLRKVVVAHESLL